VRPQRVRLEHEAERALLDGQVDARAPSKNTPPSSWMRPPDGCSRPATARSNVVLPLPDAPSRHTTSPAFSSNDTPLRIGLAP
jgi:hypothetical protein